jgi:hypothetical protein
MPPKGAGLKAYLANRYGEGAGAQPTKKKKKKKIGKCSVVW